MDNSCIRFIFIFFVRTAVDEFCGGVIEDSVYLHTIIIGLACIPTSFWLPLCVHKLGAKFFLGKNSIFNFIYYISNLCWYIKSFY